MNLKCSTDIHVPPRVKSVAGGKDTGSPARGFVMTQRSGGRGEEGIHVHRELIHIVPNTML